MEIVMFPDEVIQLNKELATPYHPELVAILHKLPSNVSFQERLGHIAAYCDLVLDGMYSPDDIAGICDELANRLYLKRKAPEAQVIVPLH